MHARRLALGWGTNASDRVTAAMATLGGPLTRSTGQRRAFSVFCVLLTSCTGCGSLRSDSSLQAAQVRFVEVAPGLPEVDIYVNGSGAAYGLGFANFTSYLPVLPGAAMVSAHRAGASAALTTGEITLSGGRQYTAVLSHGPTGVQEHLFADQDTPAPAGQVGLRVLNAVEGTGSLTVYVSANGGGTTAAPEATLHVSRGGASGYESLTAPATYTVTATVAEGVLNIPCGTASVKAVSGAVRTVVFAGTAKTCGKGVVSFVLDDVDPQ